MDVLFVVYRLSLEKRVESKVNGRIQATLGFWMQTPGQFSYFRRGGGGGDV